MAPSLAEPTHAADNNTNQQTKNTAGITGKRPMIFKPEESNSMEPLIGEFDRNSCFPTNRIGALMKAIFSDTCDITNRSDLFAATDGTCRTPGMKRRSMTGPKR